MPSWLAYLVRALVVPGAFMAAAFLAPLAEPIAAQIEHEARATLADVFKIARKQRKRLLAEADRTGRDMTAALFELVPDAETRRINAHAYGAIGAPISAVFPVEHVSGNVVSPDPEPEPPTTERAPRVRTDADDREMFAGAVQSVPSLTVLSRHAASVQTVRGVMSRDAALRTQAFALLDANPRMSRNALRDALHVRRETASALYQAWEIERAKTRAVR